MLVEQFIAIRAVKALDVGVLVGIARLNELDRHAGIVCSTSKDFSQEFRTVVGTEYLLQTVLGAKSLEYAHPPKSLSDQHA